MIGGLGQICSLRGTAPVSQIPIRKGMRAVRLQGSHGHKYGWLPQCEHLSEVGEGRVYLKCGELFLEGGTIGRQTTIAVYLRHCLLKTALEFQKHSPAFAYVFE